MTNLTEIIYFGFELEMLHAHLQAHHPFVNHTIVVECPNTTTGIPKPCLFNENKSKFSKFNIEHIILPASTFPIATQTYNEFKHQDNNWKKTMQPYASFGADWVWHNDTDEILSETFLFSFRSTLNEVGPEVRTINYHLSQRSPYVNMFNGIFHVHRMHRAGPDYVYPKDFRRVTFPDTETNGGRNEIGWHFTNCFSNAEELYWKVKCRNWLVPEVSIQTCEEALKLGLYNLKDPKFDSIRNIIPPDPGHAADSSWGLPNYIMQNPEKFPIWLGDGHESGLLHFGSR